MEHRLILNIDVSAVVVYTNKLEKLHKSGIPVAVRTALNSAAFDVKQNTMPQSAQQRFVQRQPNFFKANSRVEMAKGWDIRTMAATVGFISDYLKVNSTNFAVKDLEQQEYGGQIDAKAFIPLDPARSGGSFVKPVRPINRLTEITGIVDAAKIVGASRKAAFVKAAIKAGPGGTVLGNLGKQKLWRIDSITKKGNTIDIKKTVLYSYKQGRSVNVKETGFMRWATLKSGNRLEEFYIKEAQKQIDRLTK